MSRIDSTNVFDDVSKLLIEYEQTVRELARLAEVTTQTLAALSATTDRLETEHVLSNALMWLDDDMS